MVERPSWAQVIAFAAITGVTCSAGTVLGASAATAALRAPAGLVAAPAIPAAGPGPAAAAGWGVQPMGGSPNPTGVTRRTVQPTVYVPPVPGDAVQASRGAQPTPSAQPAQPGRATLGGPVGAPVGLPAGAPVGAPVAPPTPAATPTTTGQARAVQLPPALPTITSRASAFPRTAPPAATAPTATAPTVPRPPATPPLPTPPAVITTTVVTSTAQAPRQTLPAAPGWTPTVSAVPQGTLPPVPTPVGPAQPNPPVAVQVVAPPGAVAGTPSVPASVPASVPTPVATLSPVPVQTTVAVPAGQGTAPVSITLNLNVGPGGWSVATQPTAVPLPSAPSAPGTTAAPVTPSAPTAPNPQPTIPQTVPPTALVPADGKDQPSLPDRPPPPTAVAGAGQPAVPIPAASGDLTQPGQPTPSAQPTLPGAPAAATATASPTGAQQQPSLGDRSPGESGSPRHGRPTHDDPGHTDPAHTDPGQSDPATPRPAGWVPAPEAGRGPGSSGPGTTPGSSPGTAPGATPGPGTSGAPGTGTAGGSGLGGEVRGWSSGASGPGVADGSFAGWRGSPVTVAGTWNDGDAASQTDLPTLKGEFKDWTGDLDVAVGGTELGSGESYAQAAQGAYQQRWTTMAQNLQAARGDKPGMTYVRPFHEFNGNWYANWFVTPDNLQDYKTSFRLMAATIRANCQRCKIVWSPGNGSSSGAAKIADAWPGDDVVDVVGVDTYNANGNTRVTDATSWQEYANATNGGDPVGPEAWRQFAASHGKPISFPEWGLNSGGGGGDDPQYIQSMHDWMAEHAARPGEDLAGKVLYDVYFDIAMGDNNGFVIKDGPNPQSGRLYTSLRWGTADGSTAPPGQAPSGQAPSPLTPAQVQNLQVGPVGRRSGAEPSTVKDVAYADRSPAQHLDLYLPRGTGAAVPLVVQIHGGAFSEGDKTDADLVANIEPLLAQGYAVANINYRLSGEAPFPAGLQDAKAAVRWLRAHAAEHGLDPNRFAAWGSSAGGYLATMLGITGGQANAVLDDAELGNTGVRSAVQAVVSLYGPADFAAMDTQLAGSGCDASARTHDQAGSPESVWLGAPVQESPLKDASNPIAWLGSAPAGTLPPFFLGHGGSDCTVPAGQSAELSDALKRAGTTVQLQVVSGAGHSDPAIDEGLRQPAIDFLTQRLTTTPAQVTLQPAAQQQPAQQPTQQQPAQQQPAQQAVQEPVVQPTAQQPVATETRAAPAADPPAVSSTGS